MQPCCRRKHTERSAVRTAVVADQWPMGCCAGKEAGYNEAETAVGPPGTETITPRIPKSSRRESRASRAKPLSTRVSILSSRRWEPQPPQELVISGPTNVVHVQHLGWSVEGGFKLEHLPGEWKYLLKAAGVRKADLEDKATAEVIAGVLTQHMTLDEASRLPALPGISEQATPLPAGWKAATTRDGRRYYYHSASKETRWNRPNAAPLPAGWREAVAPDGRSYFFEKSSGKTQWLRPGHRTPDVLTTPTPAPAAATTGAERAAARLAALAAQPRTITFGFVIGDVGRVFVRVHAVGATANPVAALAPPPLALPSPDLVALPPAPPPPPPPVPPPRLSVPPPPGAAIVAAAAAASERGGGMGVPAERAVAAKDGDWVAQIAGGDFCLRTVPTSPRRKRAVAQVAPELTSLADTLAAALAATRKATKLDGDGSDDDNSSDWGG